MAKHDAKRSAALLRRQSGLLGLASIVRAFPYSLPSYMPQVLVELSKHLSDPDPLKKIPQSALEEFKRTHQDTWHQISSKFSRDEWEAIEDALVSPHYYA